jgi:hypothetical protein
MPAAPCPPPYCSLTHVQVETGLAVLAKQVERNAYELTGQPPVQVLSMDQLAKRVGDSLAEAVSITRKKSLLEDALGVRG